MSSLSVPQGRWCVVAAAVLWSLSGAFIKLLTQPQASSLAEPPVEGLVIAFYRALFAGLTFSVALRRSDITFRPMMLVMVLSFAAMNALFVSAVKEGTAANAIILQYTAPLWLYLASIFLLKEPANRRSTIALIVAMTGIAVIVGDALRQPTSKTFQVVLIGLGSGVAYAGVILCLRVLRGASSRWLTVQNHLFAALVLLPIVWFRPSPTAEQFAILVLFGSVQMALPYWLVSRGLRVLSAQEVGTICLLEPILNPIWTYLVFPEEIPATSTFIGGGLILMALVWRYWPVGEKSAA